MDFSSLNPITSNSLNLAARNNDIQAVKRLLKKMNPACIDNRGWTCLHEAAANDCYESMLLILRHPDCRPLAETHEGHTALYLACRQQSSLRTIEALLESVEDIANYGSTESVTPLHIASSQGRLEVIQLLIDHGAIIDVQDFDGDTPLHDAANKSQYEAIAMLLHAGADPNINNESNFTPFHLACYKGCYNSMINLFPFVTDLNQVTSTGHSPLMLGVQGCQLDIVKFLLENGADPHLISIHDNLALDTALHLGYSSIFKILLDVTDKDKINRLIILQACRPHLFQLEILEELLNFDFEPSFFDFHERFFITLERIGGRRPFYYISVPLNSYLNVCEYIYEQSRKKFREFFYLFLMRGVSVNALDDIECPPLVYIHFCQHAACFEEVFEILRENDCNIDYCSSNRCYNKDKCIPDVFLASLSSDPSTTLFMLPYSLYCEPGYLLHFAYKYGVLNRMPPSVQTRLIAMIDNNFEGVTPETLDYYVPSLKHLCRLKIRSILRRKCIVKCAQDFLKTLNLLPLPFEVKHYLRYI